MTDKECLALLQSAKEWGSWQIASVISNLVAILCERTHMWRAHMKSAELQQHLYDLEAQMAIDARTKK